MNKISPIQQILAILKVNNLKNWMATIWNSLRNRTDLLSNNDFLDRKQGVFCIKFLQEKDSIENILHIIKEPQDNSIKWLKQPERQIKIWAYRKRIKRQGKRIFGPESTVADLLLVNGQLYINEPVAMMAISQEGKL